MIPHRTPFFLPLLYPTLTWRMNSNEKTIYLTFDDGPVSGPTEFVLDVLGRALIKATFFCLGDNIRKHPAVFASILAGGHTVGNHTVNHLNGWKSSVAAFTANVEDFDSIATSAGLVAPTRLFRPPYGRITRRQIRALKAYRIVMWDVLSQDYNHSVRPERCLRRTLSVCRPGSVIVFHDSYKSERNMSYVLPRLIETLASDGYTFAKF